MKTANLITRIIRPSTIAAAAVVVLLAAPGCASTTMPTGPSPATSVSASAVGQQVLLRFGDRTATATLADTAAARDLVSRLPLSLDLSPAMGQAYVGPLAFTLKTSTDEAVRSGSPGGIYYVPDVPALAIYHDDLGQTVPPPGLVPLATIADPDVIARLGGTGRVTIESVVQPRR